MVAILAIAAAVLLAAFIIIFALSEMRNARGLYGWPRWVQALICISDGIPLSSVGKFQNNEEFVEHVFPELRNHTER